MTQKTVCISFKSNHLYSEKNILSFIHRKKYLTENWKIMQYVFPFRKTKRGIKEKIKGLEMKASSDISKSV